MGDQLARAALSAFGAEWRGNAYREDEPRGAGRPGISPRKTGDNDSGAGGDCPPLFSGILPGEYTRISSIARVKEFARGEMLYIEGESVRQILLIASGFVKINRLGLGGTEVILRLGVPGDVLGAAGLFSTGSHCTSAQAFRSCRALVWEAPVFKTLLERHPVLHQNMARILGGYLLELEERFGEVATERVGPRVARQLVRLLKQIGRPVDGAIEIGLSREELAQMTGTTLFTVSRLFSAWEARGMVRPRREAVAICDEPSLRAVSEQC
jgi:CRP/FNR family transcriptional regulator, nitrogen oxide reductase regulator